MPSTAARRAGPEHDRHAHHDHRQRQRLAHGQADPVDVKGQPDRVARADELRIGLAHELHQKTCRAVARKEHARQRPAPFQPAPGEGQPEQQQAQQQPLQPRLVELAGMPRAGSCDTRAILRGRTGKDHAPGQVGGPAPELGIDEIGDTDKENGRRRGQRHEVGDIAQPQAGLARHQPDRQHNPQEPAVKGHAPLPEHRDLQRVLHVVAGPVEQHIAQPPANDDAQDDRGQQVLDLCAAHRCGVAGPQPRPGHGHHRQPPAQQDADDIGHGIPAQGETGTEQLDRDDHGADVGEGNAGGHGRCLGRGTGEVKPAAGLPSRPVPPIYPPDVTGG